MHEYRLYTTIPTSRRAQALNIFAGITASQPVPVTQQVLIFQQLKAENTPAAKKGQAKSTTPAPGQQQRLNYVKVVRDINSGAGEPGSWRLREEGLPDPAAKSVTSVPFTERELADSDIPKFSPDSETHKYTTQYASSGTRFVHQNIVIYLNRLYTASPPPPGIPPLDSPPPTLENGNLLDPSGAWLVEVCVRVEDGGNAGLRDKAVKQLEGFQKELEGAVDLRVPDRLAMDPRVR